jgi:primase-polymerase (primpol)-like protein
MTMTLTKREAFEAMRCFLAQFNEREPPERRRTIEQILSWTEIEADGGTSDPAQWHDWEEAVALAISRLGPSSEG